LHNGLISVSPAPTKPRKLSRRTRALLRKTNTALGDRWGQGGMLKSKHRPRAVTLARVMCLERPAPDEDGDQT
jgi:hypothetical protein